MWIFFDTATPKRGVQLSHDIESVTCDDKVIKFDFRQEGSFSPTPMGGLQNTVSRKLPILVSFPSKEDANAAFVGMAEQMAKQSGNWFVYPAPEPSEREAPHNVRVKGKVVIQTSEPWVPPIAVFDDKEWVPTKYPLVGGDGRHFRIEQDGKGNIIFQYEDGTKDIFPLTFFPEAAGK